MFRFKETQRSAARARAGARRGAGGGGAVARRMAGALAAVLFVLNILMENAGAHVFQLERDFSGVAGDRALAKDVEEVVRRLRTFKVAVHPRIRLLYRLLKRGMARYAHRAADSLFVPHAYRAPPARGTGDTGGSGGSGER